MEPINESEELTWAGIKEKSVRLLGGLLMEKSQDNVWTISLGRISFWLLFIPALVIWVSGDGVLSDGVPVKDISPNHLTLLLTLAAYNFGKKLTDTANKMWGKNNGPG